MERTNKNEQPWQITHWCFVGRVGENEGKLFYHSQRTIANKIYQCWERQETLAYANLNEQ